MIMALASMVFSGIFKVIPGLGKSWMDMKKSEGIQETKKQGIWATAMTQAAQTDVENRKLAMAERSAHPVLMALYVILIAGPTLYWTMFWMDTIFAENEFGIWITIFGYQLIDWTWIDFKVWNLTRAPARLEEFGTYIITTFVGGQTAVAGVTKAITMYKKK